MQLWQGRNCICREYLGALDDIDVAKEMLHDATDADEKEMLQMEISENEAKLPQLEEDIKIMLIPGDPMDEKDTIVEIRSAAGGDEAAIFAGDLFKMYQRFIESKKWKMTVLDSSPSEAGGFKSIEFKVEGDKVYSVMKYESGVHRVQRVPKTESQGRIQTSTATVAVLPEADEVEVEINENDLRIDVYRAGGPGGHGAHFHRAPGSVRFPEYSGKPPPLKYYAPDFSARWSSAHHSSPYGDKHHVRRLKLLTASNQWHSIYSPRSDYHPIR